MPMKFRLKTIAAGMMLLSPVAALSAPPASAPPAPAVSTSPATGPSQTGQPGASCGSATAPNTPGYASSAPGSAFNPNGVADSHYAGTQPQNSRNPVSVSQYDSACLHQPK